MELMQDKAGVRVKPQGAQWHAVVRSRLAGRFEGIARIVSGRKSGAALEFDLIRYGSSAMSLEVRAGGRRAYLKLFDPAHTDYAYQREKAALCALRESGLVPRILAYADKPRFLLCEWSGAAAETEGNASLSPTQFAEKLGVWLAELDSVVPGEDACGNWYTYLQQFSGVFDMERIRIARDMLSEIPLCGRAMSRNDTALTSFLDSAEGHLMGCDFERAQMRPRGWDYVLGYIGLIEQFPENTGAVLEAYSAGFSRAHKGALIVEELNVVSRILYTARAMADGRGAQLISWQ
ncbi:hypothetical protein ACS3QZ_02675 [Shimia sp. W99]